MNTDNLTIDQKIELIDTLLKDVSDDWCTRLNIKEVDDNDDEEFMSPSSTKKQIATYYAHVFSNPFFGFTKIKHDLKAINHIVTDACKDPDGVFDAETFYQMQYQ